MNATLATRVVSWLIALAAVLALVRIVTGWANPWSAGNLVRETAPARDAKASALAPSRAASALWIPSCADKGCDK